MFELSNVLPHELKPPLAQKIWKLKKHFVLRIFECSKFDFFVMSVPVKIQVHIVPHLNALIYIRYEPLNTKG